MKNTVWIEGVEYPDEPPQGTGEGTGEEAGRGFLLFPEEITPMMSAKNDFYNTACADLPFLRAKAEALIALCDLHEVPRMV